MANEQARKFLSDESKEQLENSIGVRNVINKQRKVGEVIEIIYGYWDKISANNESINAKRAEVDKLNATSLLKKLFSNGKIKKQIETLNEQISALASKNEELKATVSRYEAEHGLLVEEIARFGEELKKVGLTPDDIILEYEIISKEIEEGKNKQPAPVQQEPKPEKKPAKITTGTKQSTRLSPIDKFNNRMRKYQEMQSQKAEPIEQEKQ